MRHKLLRGLSTGTGPKLQGEGDSAEPRGPRGCSRTSVGRRQQPTGGDEANGIAFDERLVSGSQHVDDSCLLVFGQRGQPRVDRADRRQIIGEFCCGKTTLDIDSEPTAVSPVVMNGLASGSRQVSTRRAAPPPRRHAGW